jgi:hypothetical protein
VGWRENLVDDDAGLTQILRQARTIAVLGAKAPPYEPAHYVPAYLLEQGYRILPVNPTIAGQRLFGIAVVPTLADLPRRPAVVWFQLGVRHDGAAERLARAGVRVVQDRCMMPEHRRLLRVA